jgi:hypothetical protein
MEILASRRLTVRALYYTCSLAAGNGNDNCCTFNKLEPVLQASSNIFETEFTCELLFYGPAWTCRLLTFCLTIVLELYECEIPRFGRTSRKASFKTPPSACEQWPLRKGRNPSVSNISLLPWYRNLATVLDSG